ncbi:hypothetical protein BaRGS_00001343, partial [Batillaria attramentaria]
HSFEVWGNAEHFTPAAAELPDRVSLIQETQHRQRARRQGRQTVEQLLSCLPSLDQPRTKGYAFS